ncbi:DUF4139 domain-containing protein [Candidatus Bealeia paramacronuclearis]|uniref:DUF4139 domain-containing protein n=1 Tax=Candidatus Bealeia paramacronuclearis TaxID=1921001 RepID=A0ABZ2C182_9PROT|nr:hypothetical protein [Candidatus Bealeia paramacronuclearis]
MMSVKYGNKVKKRHPESLVSDLIRNHSGYQKILKQVHDDNCGGCNSINVSFLTLIFFLLTPPLSSASTEQNVTQAHQSQIEVTVYPKGQALIHERRSMKLVPGSNKLVLLDIPSSIVKDSVLFRALNDPNQELKLLEYTLKSGPISSQVMLENAIDQEILILPSAGLGNDTLKSKLLGLDGKRAVVQVLNRVQSVPQESLAFEQLPARLSTQPELIIKVESPYVKETEAEIVYLTDGLSWDAAYTVVIHADANFLDLNSWINFHNDSGIELQKAMLNFSDAQSSKEKSTGQIFKIERPTTVADRTSKSVAWVDRDNIRTRKSYRIYPKVNLNKNEEGVVMKPPVETWLSIGNTKDNQLGIPLPAGVVKVYQQGVDANLRFVGENKTPSLGIGDELSLRLSTNPEITADMWQTDFRKLGEQVIETGYRLDIKNNSKISQKVTVVQDMSDKDWLILRETHPHQEKNHQQVLWEIDLPSDGSESLRYRIRQNLME